VPCGLRPVQQVEATELEARGVKGPDFISGRVLEEGQDVHPFVAGRLLHHVVEIVEQMGPEILRSRT